MSDMIVAVIGRPNVGKSTLFNRITGTRRALVHHKPGTTRDRTEAPVEWNGKRFLLVDTGGWEDKGTVLSKAVKKQMTLALEMAGLVVFVVDAKEGVNPLDTEIFSLLRRKEKNVLVVVNKVDTRKDEIKANDFYSLGVKGFVMISGIHGINIDILLDAIAARVVTPEEEEAAPASTAIRIVLVGKPNVGKSSLLNALMKEERVIVNDMPGTTREAVDITLRHGEQEFVIIDTPGLHRKNKFTDDLEYLANLSTHHALERSEVAVLVIDAVQGIGETEARIAELILKNHCGCLVAVNKWDLVEDREGAVGYFQKELERKLPFLAWAKVIFISAKTGQRTERIFSEVETVYSQYSRTIVHDELKEAVESAVRRKPLSRHGKILKIFGVEQTGIKAPYFVFKVSSTELVHFSYRRYLENQLRERFGLEGTPLVLRFKQ